MDKTVGRKITGIRIIICSIFLILLGIFPIQDIRGEEMTLSIVYNNVAYDQSLECSWGMGCVVEYSRTTILFDTGGNGEILLSNMKKMGIDPADIDLVVLSHMHGDHTGGLGEFLEHNPDVTVYLPGSSSGFRQRRVKSTGARIEEVDKAVEIEPGIYSTGTLGRGIKEQALVLESEKGLVMVTGCSHPGVDALARKAVETAEQSIYLITGGFHLGGASKREVTRIIEELRSLGVEKIAPSHCTGKKAMDLFRQSWGEDFIEAGCGARITVPF
jgi:7,8-dihydropterin-6-yl-methyl-4-(beta-D-ribofuranosyl)aminobenzene 5'-phosphate synthase